MDLRRKTDLRYLHTRIHLDSSSPWTTPARNVKMWRSRALCSLARSSPPAAGWQLASAAGCLDDIATEIPNYLGT